MKVCLINNLYPPLARGGAEQVVYKTVQGLLAIGHQVIVITTAPGGTHVWREGKLTIYRYQPANVFFYTAAYQHSTPLRFLWHLIDRFHWPSARQVRGILEREKPDVVHTHNLIGMSFLIPTVIRRLGLRQVHTVHDVQLVEPSGVILKQKAGHWRYTGWHSRIYSGIMKRLMGSPEVVISPSQFLLEFYERRGFFLDSKRVLVRNPIALSPGPNIKAPHDGMNFLYLGQIEEHKGVRFLVESFLSLIKEFPFTSTLHIVGSGSQLAKVWALAGACSHIVIHGKVDRKELPKLFAQTDMTIVPSLCYENSPTVIFESLSFNVPVLASCVEGIEELINTGENGLTFETGESASLRDKLRWCVANKAAVVDMGKKTTRSLIGLSQRDYVEKLQSYYYP